MNDYNFGNFVCYLREQNGLTQAEIASRLGVTAAAVSKWENGSSKPRTEVLFQLAEILGVRPEELMVGHYIKEEHFDHDAVQLLNERYEYLRRIELHNETGTKIRRMLAWMIDWNIIGATVVTACFICIAIFMHKSLFTAEVLALLLIMISYPLCFVLRDLIFGGRSLGKRIMRLTILDKQTGDAPKKSQLFLRNILSCFIMQVDAIVMLATGLSLGDRLAHTVVVKNDAEFCRGTISRQQVVQEINQYPAQKRERSASNKKKLFILFASLSVAIVLFVISVIAIVNLSLERQKDSEEYRMAYAYLVESDRFRALGIEADDVELFSYSSKYANQRRSVEFGFELDGSALVYVTCHDNGDGWFVCEECTEFH